MTESERRQLADHWMNASSDETIAAELEALYTDAAAAITERGPACWASGRCCNFDKAGHKLYVTGLEAAYCLGRLTSATLWSEAAEQTVRAGSHALPVLSPAPMPTGDGLFADVEAAAARGGCPFQVRNLCGVHAIKPLGCRVYFCDRSAQAWQMDLSEQLIGKIKALHDRHDIPYRYGEWLSMLGMFRS